MLTLTTYRSRLVTYIAALLIFLVLTLVYSYWSTRDTLLQEADRSMNQATNLLTGQIEATRNELRRYARIVRDDLQVKEYMFIVVNVSNETDPLVNLYQKQFGWLPVDRSVLLKPDGEVLIGDNNATFVDRVRRHTSTLSERTFIFKGEQHLELVSSTPIYYRDELIGHVALSYSFSPEKLLALRNKSGGHIFVIEDEYVRASTVSESLGKRFHLDGAHINISDDSYRVQPIFMPDIDPGTPELWFGLSENELINNLTAQARTTLMMIIIGCISIISLGIIVIRNFSQPLSSLMTLTEQIASGELPQLGKTVAKNEIESLANQFADMLHSLREKQHEIDRVHQQLEELATTDSLTGLYNRRYLQDLFPKIEAQVRRDDKVLGVTLCDLDNFKKINDRYGHLAGDECLKHFSWLMKKYLRENDYVIRMGGEEFLILSLADGSNGHLTMAEKIRTAIQNDRINFEDTEIKMTVSCGIALSNKQNLKTLNVLLTQADAALYEAKSEGRNRVKLSQDSVDIFYNQQSA